MATLGARLRSLREQEGLTGRELAKKLNVSPSTLSQYETDTRVPSDDVKRKIADRYNVSMDYLMGRSDVLRENAQEEPNADAANTSVDTSMFETIALHSSVDVSELDEEDREKIYEYAAMLVEKAKRQKQK